MVATSFPYDPVGALGGVFAPAYIANDPVSKAAVDAWNAAHMKFPPGQDPNTSAQQQQQAAMGSLFAPPFTAGDPASAAAVEAWMAAHPQAAPASNSGPPPAAPAAPAAAPQAAQQALQLMGFGQFGQPSSVAFPSNWINSNNPFQTS
jgi:hypothetical protein